MELSSFDVTVAFIMVTATVILLDWFIRSQASGSLSRMKGMMARIRLNPGIVTDTDPKIMATMNEARRLCGRCPHEGLCERWLAGEIEGPNTFCVNAPTFRALAETAAA